MTALFTYLGWTWALAVLGTTAVALVLAASRMWRPAIRLRFSTASPPRHWLPVW
jgi:hypothetical protein